MKPKSAFTLVEVILSVALLGIVVVTFLTGIGQGYLLMSKGSDYTAQTFDAQEQMEELIAEEKNNFIANPSDEDFSVTLFSGDYQSTIGLKEISTNVSLNRSYTTYVSSFELLEPPAPILLNFEVMTYRQGTNSIVFPWFEEPIELRASYTVDNNPIIYQNRNRWYISSEIEKAPIFSSDYEVYSEEFQDMPSTGSYQRVLVKNTGVTPIEAKRFYYFEARPFTLEGRIAIYRNDDRILVLNRNGSDLWQTFIEDAYFDRVNRLKTDTYVDVMQNPDWPTLDTDWALNEDPEGALVSTRIPASILGNAFKADVNFEMDKDALIRNNSILGAGIALLNASNSGYMLTFDAIHNEITINKLDSGNYEGSTPLKSIDVLTDAAFDKFRVTVGGIEIFDWTKSLYSTLSYKPEESKLEFQLHFVNDADEVVSSELISLDLVAPLITPEFIGFKAYSGLDYRMDNQFEIIDEYERNYAAHFNNLTLTSLSTTPDPDEDDVVDIIINKNIFVYGSEIDFQGNEIIGNNSAVFISNKEGTLEYANLNGGATINVSNIYIQGKINIDSGSADLGSRLYPGEIHVDNDVRFGTGGRDIYGDMYINGDFRIGQATVHGNVYVDGDFGLGSSIGRNFNEFLSMEGHVYYTGNLIEMPSYFDTGHANFPATKVASVNPVEIPKLDMPTYQPDQWYQDRGYNTNKLLSLSNGLKLFVENYSSTSWLPTTRNVIIVAKSGDIKITGMGGSTLTGILFAPNGKVTFSGERFEGLVIAKDGFFVPSGGTIVEFKPAGDFVNTEDIPLKAPTK